LLLKLYNFALTENTGPDQYEEPEVLGTLEAGFYLKKFSNEAHFNQHMELLKMNHSICSFDYFLDREDDAIPGFDNAFGGEDDDIYAAQARIPNADHGILLKLRGTDSGSLDAGGVNITYSFKPGEAGLYFLIYQVCPYDPKK